MKKSRYFTAIALAACMVVPMAMAAVPFTASAASVEITGIGTEQHDFEVYQILKGDLVSGKLSNLVWGSGITAYNSTSVTAGSKVDDAIVTAMSGTDARSIVSKITLGTACKTVSSSSPNLTIDGLEDGYYVVKDVTDLDDKDDANSAWIVQVAGEAHVAVKTAKPTVDKQIQDEAADKDTNSTDAEGWGETADHAINEQFQFKLTAKIPANDQIKAYDAYKLVFHDSMSAGVTFDSIASVTVGGSPVTTYTETATGAADKAGLSWELTIDDVKPLVPSGITWGEKEIVVEVVYNAHLNENAIVSKSDVTDGDKDHVNNNKVYLEYSNNPDSTGTGTNKTGKTPEDYVWAFTYGVDNTKYKNEALAGNELQDAGFRLYDAAGTTEIGLIFDTAKNAYRPIKSGEAAAEMKSAADGKFNIIGLDAGTYTLRETTTPTGYNTCADVQIVIAAAHNESASGTAANLALTGSQNMNNNIVNKEGSTLPSTGGIGTTIFYGLGGVLVLGSGVALVTKKRMKKDEE